MEGKDASSQSTCGRCEGLPVRQDLKLHRPEKEVQLTRPLAMHVLSTLSADHKLCDRGLGEGRYHNGGDIYSGPMAFKTAVWERDDAIELRNSINSASLWMGARGATRIYSRLLAIETNQRISHEHDAGDIRQALPTRKYTPVQFRQSFFMVAGRP